MLRRGRSATTSPFVPTRVERRGGEIGKLTAMLNFIERKKAFVLVALLAASAAGANELVSYQLAADLPLKHDGYIVERLGTGNGERARFVVKAETARAFLYANYESNRWMNARSYPFVRDPHFKTRALDVSRSPEPLRDWIAATGANAVYFKRGRPNAKRLRECAALGVDAYSFLYGCDAAKWNRARYDEFVTAHPSAKGVSPEKSWEKGTLCPSDAATAAFFGEAVRAIAVPEVVGVVVCLWDDYGLNCACDRCKANGFAGNWGRQVAFAVKAWEGALKPLKKKLIVRTWSSGASHWLGDEWVHAPGYGGPSGEPLSVWGEAMRRAGTGVLFQTKVYNADCQPNPPFSALLQVAPRRDIAEWQITGQTVGRQYFPAPVVAQTARQFARVKDLVSPEGGVMLYAGTYKRDGYAALSDRLNSVNLHVWRQLSWDPGEDVDALWREWAELLYGVSLIDAQTGRTLLRTEGPCDTGSCNAMDIDPDAPGVELFSGANCGIYSAKTFQRYLHPKPKPTINYYATLRFGIWWTGDLTRSAYSGGDILYGYSVKDRQVRVQWSGGGETGSNHGSKGAPCLAADILGDWREDLLLRRKDNRAIRVYLTPEPTRYRFHTLMEDPVYRWSVATQNNGYNMPAEPGFYFGPELLGIGVTFRGALLGADGE